MKKASFLLSCAAVPLMLMAVPVAAGPQASSTPLVLAQGGPGNGEEEPRRRPNRPERPEREQRRERPDRPERPERPAAQEQRGPRRGADQDGPPGRQRPPRAAPAEAPEPARPQRQQRPAERAAPAPRPAQVERPRPPEPSAERRRRDQEAPGERRRPRQAEEPVRTNRPVAQEPQRPSAVPPPEERRGRPQDPERRRAAPPAPAAQSPAPPQERPDRRERQERQERQRIQRPAEERRAPPQPAPQQAAPTAAQPLDPATSRIEDIRRQRRQRVEDGGRRVIIEEPGNRTIIREGNRAIIRHDDTERFRRTYRDADIRTERRGPDEEVTIIRRPDGTEVVTVRDQYGNIVRRVRREPTGREIVIIDDRGWERRPRRGFYVEEEVLRLPPPVINIPREEYIVEMERASERDIYEAFVAPPVERIERAYSLNEVRQSYPLRERMRRVDLDTINFDFGSWDLPGNQIDALATIAQALQEAISRNPGEVFLIEGHTDAVGSDEDNLTLSDRRAETVATILTQRFQIPAENLVIQGYGEQYLKVNTQQPERENRRVTIRRITPLLQGQNQP